MDNINLCWLQLRTGSKAAPYVFISDFIGYQWMIKEAQRAKITCPASHFMNLWHFGQPSLNCKTTLINMTSSSDASSWGFWSLSTGFWDAGWRKTFPLFSLQKGHMVRDRHRSWRKRESRILDCSNTIKQKDIISYQLTILIATSWKQNDLKNKIEWVSKTKRQLCCPFVPTFSQQIKTRLTAGCFTVRPLIEVCSSSFSMSWFYEAAATKIINID